MWPLWLLFGCLVGLSASISTSASTTTTTSKQCTWRDLNTLEFTSTKQTIQVRAKDEANGTITTGIYDIHGNWTFFSRQLETTYYNLTMNCDGPSCHSIYSRDEKIEYEDEAFIVGFKMFVLEGKNVEWSQNCTEEVKEDTTTTPLLTTPKSSPTTTTTLATSRPASQPTTTPITTTTKTAPETTATPSSATTTQTSRPKPTKNTKPSNSSGVIAGIVVFLLVIAMVVVCVTYRKYFHSSAVSLQDRARSLMNENEEVMVTNASSYCEATEKEKETAV